MPADTLAAEIVPEYEPEIVEPVMVPFATTLPLASTVNTEVPPVPELSTLNFPPEPAEMPAVTQPGLETLLCEYKMSPPP